MSPGPDPEANAFVDRFVRDVVTHATADAPTTLDQILPRVYTEFRGLASQLMRWERSDHTLRTTALAHEAYLRLASQRRSRIDDGRHLLALAATAMRRVLVDHARAHAAAKRGSDRHRVPLSSASVTPAQSSTPDLLALEEALMQLSEESPRAARSVELIYFAGLTHEEVADVLEVSLRTVVRDWRYARAFLWEILRDDGVDDPGSRSGGS